METAKHINDYEPRVIRNMQNAHAKDGSLPRSPCPHPTSAMNQFFDDDSRVNRNARPTNLFVCEICNQYLRLVDFHGKEAADG